MNSGKPNTVNEKCKTCKSDYMSFVISNKRQCYRYTTTNGLLIKDAAELCQKNGGKLPIPKSQEEQDLLINMLNNKIPKKVHVL